MISLLVVSATGVITYLVFKRTETIKTTHLLILLCIVPSLLSLNLSFSPTFVFTIYLFTILLCTAIYRLSPWHPLAVYPGPFLCKLTKFRGAYEAQTGKQHLWYKTLHERYGDVVRIGPNELSFISSDALAPVLGQNGLPKGPFMDGRFPETLKVLPIGGLKDPEEHRRRRAPWNKAFSSSALKEYEILVLNRTTLLGNRLAEESKGKAVNFGEWMGWYTLRVLLLDEISVTNVFLCSFSGGSEMLLHGDPDGLVNDVRSGNRVALFMSHVPWLGRLCYRIPGNIYTGPAKFRQASRARAMKRKELGDNPRKDLYYYLLGEGGEKKLHTDAEAIADASAAVLGGTDTTSNTTTLIVFYLLTRPKVYEGLKKEVDSMGDRWNDASAQAKMAYLNAVINETLRLWPAVLSGSQRKVRSDGPGKMVGEHYVPPKTNVTIPFYTLHRDSRNFSPAPDEWIPERWLSGSDYRNEMKAFTPFSLGQANCAGKNLAMMEMRMVVCMLVKRFTMHLDGFEGSVKDYWLMQTGELWVEFSERE
uniref:Cytochrome p450 n=1 Tax=Moniliophthora roreri TaxID=221103 RepID=A0A0W0F2Y0_MONRR